MENLSVCMTFKESAQNKMNGLYIEFKQTFTLP